MYGASGQVAILLFFSRHTCVLARRGMTAPAAGRHAPGGRQPDRLARE